MKIGLSVKIDVTKIDKARLFEGKKGVYLDLTTFIDVDEKDQYGNNGFITQSTSKEEREQGIKTPILGNVMVFMQDSTPGAPPQGPADYQPTPSNPTQFVDEDPDSIPF